MDFPKSIRIDACEKFLIKLESKKDDRFLRLPVGTTRYAFGGLASAIQAVNTWVRVSEIRSLALSPSKAKNEIEDLIQRPHKFAAAIASRSIVLSSQIETELRPKVNAAAKLAIENQSLNKFGQQHGRLCWFAFVDHSSKGFDRNFYIEKVNENPEPRRPEQFKAVIRAMVDKAMSVAGGAKDLEPESLAYVGRIFYELFLNTHEHGSRGRSRSEWLKPGVRILYTQAINLSEAAARNTTEKQPILTDYLSAVARKHGPESQRRFVEISIVDSGLGYCERWLSDHSSVDSNADYTVGEEYEIFKKCFKFRQSSTTKGSKGNGLPVVMDRLTKLGGLMRVRSGRLSLYRDFIESPYVSGDSCGFYDWDSGQSAEQAQTPMPLVAGVAISLLIPLEEK